MGDLPVIKGSRRSAPRIRQEQWEKLKDTILELYQARNLPLDKVRVIMERVYGFCPTRRQYIHILDKWGITKYRKNTIPRRPSNRDNQRAVILRPRPVEESRLNQNSRPQIVLPPTALQQTSLKNAAAVVLPVSEIPLYIPQMDLGDASLRDRHRLLAEILFELGDIHSPPNIRPTPLENERLTADIIAYVRTAQTQKQADAARELLKPIAKTLLSDKDSSSWVDTLLDILLAHTYDHTAGTFQIEKIVENIIIEDDERQEYLKPLHPRGPRLDIPAYRFLHSTLLLYNQRLQPEHEGEEDEIEISEIMKEFLDQQPAFHGGLDHMETDPLLDIDCLPSCLRWCAEMLKSNPEVAVDIPGTGNSTPIDICTVLVTLWHLWLTSSLLPPSFNIGASNTNLLSFPTWAENTEPQLGISATDLLGEVVRMIMAAVPNRERRSGKPLLERALAGATILTGLCPKELIRRFFNQVDATDLRLLWQTRNDTDLRVHTRGVEGSLIEPLRQLAASTLRVSNFPPLPEGDIVYPGALEDPDDLFDDKSSVTVGDVGDRMADDDIDEA
ncbi:hypothetical protein VTI74DRAFT_4248 [Chaetomium olivicolor]